MKPNLLRILPLAAIAALGYSGVASSQSMNQLIAAAKSEGQLTVIALPHDWCGYGDVIDGFKAKYGLTVNELNPDAGSGDEVEAIKANKGNTGPQAPDVIDVGLSFGPTAKADRPDPALQGLDLGRRSPTAPRTPMAYWYGDYYGVLAFEVNNDIVKKAPTDWADLLGADYKNAVALAGDPRASNQAIQAVYAAGLSATGGDAKRRRCRPEVLRRAQQDRQLRAGHRQGRARRPGRDARRHPLGLQRARRPRHAQGQPAGRRGRAADRRRRRRLRAGDQRLRAASERRQAVDGVSSTPTRASSAG